MKQDRSVLRILDANLNRAKEAFRVGEDLARLILDDSGLAQEFKKIRHEVTQALFRLPIAYTKLLQARDARRDVGKRSSIQDLKKSRHSWSDLMISNMKRAQEALRVLEECSKVISPKSSVPFQKIRFEAYELEKRAVSKF